MIIFVKLQRENRQRAIVTLPLQCGDFDSELEILYVRILVAQDLLVLTPSFDFVFHFNSSKALNMMAIILDPHFKGF
jgi:hypothetical protein